MADVLPMPAFEEALRRSARSVDDTLDALLPRGEGPEARLFEAMRYATLNGGVGAILFAEPSYLASGVFTLWAIARSGKLPRSGIINHIPIHASRPPPSNAR